MTMDGSDNENGFMSMRRTDRRMSRFQRRKKRLENAARKCEEEGNENENEIEVTANLKRQSIADSQFAQSLAQNEDEMLEFVAQVNKIYQEKLNKPAPFMTFVFCGMQSSGKSTILERFMNAVINIVQEGTGTRCPLDTTCIHDASLTEPLCDLSGDDLDQGDWGGKLTTSEVFDRIIRHNKKLGDEDRFSANPLRLIFRAKNVQNMRFVDTPGIMSNASKIVCYFGSDRMVEKSNYRSS